MGWGFADREVKWLAEMVAAGLKERRIEVEDRMMGYGCPECHVAGRPMMAFRQWICSHIAEEVDHKVRWLPCSMRLWSVGISFDEERGQPGSLSRQGSCAEMGWRGCRTQVGCQ